MQLLSHSSVRFCVTLLLLCGLAPVGFAVTRGSTGSISVAEQLLLNEANGDRSTHNLPSLKRDPQLAQAALFHAYQMAEHADISHGFPGEPDLSSRGAHAGVHFSLITENVAQAQDPAIIHGLWMNSPGHRANLLDPAVNVVGIAVVIKGEEVFAVEDFASTVDSLSIEDQESAVNKLLTTTGLKVNLADDDLHANARQTCGMLAGYAGPRQPWFILRYSASRLDRLPTQVQSRLTSGRFHQAVVGACASPEATPFSAYTIAILLYP